MKERIIKQIEEIDSELQVVVNSGYKDENTMDYIYSLQEEKAKLIMKMYAN